MVVFIILINSQLSLATNHVKSYTECLSVLGLQGGFCELSTKISSVYPPITDVNRRFGDPKNVLVAWGGAAYDKVNKVFYFMGGGHADYAGNEVYSFDLKTAQWKRLTDPSPLDFIGYASGSSDAYIKIPDIRKVPGASHSYDGLQYRQETGTILYNTSTPSGKIAAPATSSPADSNFIDGEERKAIYEFNPSATETRNQLAPLTWRKVSRERLYYPRSVILNDGSYLVGDKFKLYKATFNADNQLITGLTPFSNQPDWGDGFARYDEERNLIWSKHDASLLSFNALTGKLVKKVTHHTSKGKSLAIANDGELVMWDGCSTIDTYDPETDVWSSKYWGDAGAQPCNQYNGYNRIYGKWQHIEGRVFAGVVNADHGVMIYVKPLSINSRASHSALTNSVSKPSTQLTLAQRVILLKSKKTTKIKNKLPSPKKKKVQFQSLLSKDIPYNDIPALQVMGLLPKYGIAKHTVGPDNNIDWTGNGGERAEIGLVPEQHAAFIAGQADLKDSILEAALAPAPAGFNHTHHPNEFWLPYLLTGNKIYVDNMEAGYKSYKDWRKQPYDSAMKTMLGREAAWNLRDLVQLAYLQGKGLTTQTYYQAALDASRDRWLNVVNNPRPDQAMFNILKFNSAGANTHGFTGWMQAMFGQALNYTAFITKDDGWKQVAAWQFQHLLKSSGDKWPLKATGYDHVFMIYFMPQGNKATWREAYDFAQTATWETISPYPPSVVNNPTYIAQPDNHLLSLEYRAGTYPLTYANRAQYAYGWAALACKNSIARACDKSQQLFDEIILRGDRWDYKNGYSTNRIKEIQISAE